MYIKGRKKLIVAGEVGDAAAAKLLIPARALYLAFLFNLSAVLLSRNIPHFCKLNPSGARAVHYAKGASGIEKIIRAAVTVAPPNETRKNSMRRAGEALAAGIKN